VYISFVGYQIRAYNLSLEGSLNNKHVCTKSTTFWPSIRVISDV